MKVTGTIKKYIKNKVTAMYQVKIKDVENSFKAEQKQLQDAIEEIANTANESARKLLDEHNFKCEWCGDPVTMIETKFMSHVVPKNYNEIKAKRDKIIEQMNNDINEIIVNMELGGDKETLDNMLRDIYNKLNKVE